MRRMEPEENRQERRKEQTKNKIIETAIKLFSDQGFESTTMEQIAEQTDIARKTLYNHFPMKEAILSEHVQKIMKEGYIELEDFMKEFPDTRSRILAGFVQSARWVQDNQDIYKVYFQYRIKMGLSSGDPNLRSGFQDLLMKILDTGQEQGEIRKDIRLEPLAFQLEYFLLAPLLAWLALPNEIQLEKLLEDNVRLFMDGAKA